VLSATVMIGAVGGAVIGGLGGRLAMRILFLTSDASVKGLKSDDGFIIGRFTLGNTIGLVIVTAFIGVIAALLYLLARPFVARLPLPPVATMAVFYGVIGGALLVHPSGVDFTRLEPAALAIAMFVAISAGFGAVAARFINAAASEHAWPQRRRWWLLGPPLLFLVFPPFLLVAIVAVVVNWGDAAAGSEDRAWRAVRVGAVAVMSGLFVLGAVDLVRDTATLT
jgi:hypothetical protein